MTKSASPTTWAENYDAAIRFTEGLNDPQRKQFVMRLVTIVTLRITQGDLPSTPIDMLFLVQSASLMYDQREDLLKIISGEDLRWWPDE